MLLRVVKTLFLALFRALALSQKKPNYRVLKRHSIPCILDLDFLSFTPHIILRSGVGTKWLLFFQSRRSFTLMSFTSNLTVLCFCYSGPAQPFIVTVSCDCICLFGSLVVLQRGCQWRCSSCLKGHCIDLHIWSFFSLAV